MSYPFIEWTNVVNFNAVPQANIRSLHLLNSKITLKTVAIKEQKSEQRFVPEMRAELAHLFEQNLLTN